MSKKELLAELMMHVGLLKLLALRRPPRLVIFNYHRLAPKEGAGVCKFDTNVFGPTAAEFDRQMEWLSRTFPMVDERGIVEIAHGREPLRETRVAITFDDGYKDNYQLALPILKKHTVPAIFFVPTDLIERRKVGWWDQVAYALSQTGATAVSLRGVRYDLADQKDQSERAIKDLFVTGSAGESETLIEELTAALGTDPPTDEEQERELMTWAEIREMSESGFAIGAHGKSHRVLTTLGRPEIRRELDESRATLEQKLQTPITSLAYPVGGDVTFSSGVQKMARDAGYQVAFSFNTGINDNENINPWNVRRTFPHPRPALVAGATVLPSLFTWSA